MQGSSSVRSDPPRWQIPRPTTDDRVLAGVAGGVARELGVDPVVVRVAFVVLTAAGGLGVVLYGCLWLLMRHHAERHAGEPYEPQPKGASEGGRIAGIACVVVGLVVAAQSLGLGLGVADSLLWPVALVGAGLVVALRRSERGPQAWAGDAARAVTTTDRLGLARVLGGLVLVGGGIATLLATQVDPGELWTVGLAVFVTVAGVALVVAPWGWRIVGELTEERRRRIRSDERAAMAAHLHDSVLQTLALIQRNANDPAVAAQLARRQERELRSWLYEGDRRPERSYRSAFEDLALDVEELHRVPVEVVVVGDAQVGERDEALVAAAREAVVNAAQHADADRVDVYVEVSDGVREAFVRDTGVGFDRAAIPAGRRGIADSILGRMERAGGTAEIESTPGAGTEVHLRLPMEARP